MQVGFADFLTNQMGFAPDGITVLSGAEASADAIMQAVIDRLVGRSAPGDRVVFYFAGLGSRLAIPGAAPKHVLLAHDAPGVLGNVPADALADIIDLLAERQVTVIVDASFRTDSADLTGGAATGRSVALGGDAPVDADASADPFGAGATDRSVWNAAAPDQFAWETSGRGVFTGLFIEAVGGGAADANGKRHDQQCRASDLSARPLGRVVPGERRLRSQGRCTDSAFFGTLARYRP